MNGYKKLVSFDNHSFFESIWGVFKTSGIEIFFNLRLLSNVCQSNDVTDLGITIVVIGIPHNALSSKQVTELGIMNDLMSNSIGMHMGQRL